MFSINQKETYIWTELIQETVAQTKIVKTLQAMYGEVNNVYDIKRIRQPSLA